MPSAQTVMTMQGNLAAAPYTLVFWLAYGQPDTTDANSGFPGQLDAATIKVNNIIQNGYTANPLSLTVSGDLSGSLPSPSVSGLQGHPIAVSTPAPNVGDLLRWSGTAWTPTQPVVPTSTVGGDLSGTLPNPSVVKLQGTPLGISGLPATGQTLVWSGTAWVPGNTLQSLAVTSGNITGPAALNITATADLNLDGFDVNITNSGGGGINISNTSGSGITIDDPAGGSIVINENGGGSLNISCDGGVQFAAPNFDINSLTNDFSIDINANVVSGGTGYNFLLQGSSALVGTSTGGNITLTPGLGASSHHGNVALISVPSHAAGVAGGSNCVWIGDRATAPGTNPTSGLIVYSESGVLKVRSGANTVTLGNKPSVTGSKASGAALISLLTVLAAAGLITDNTTA